MKASFTYAELSIRNKKPAFYLETDDPKGEKAGKYIKVYDGLNCIL